MLGTWAEVNYITVNLVKDGNSLCNIGNIGKIGNSLPPSLASFPFSITRSSPRALKTTYSRAGRGNFHLTVSDISLEYDD